MRVTIGEKQLFDRKIILLYIIIFFVIISTDTVSLPFRIEDLVSVLISLSGFSIFACYLFRIKGKIPKDVVIYVLIMSICCFLSQLFNQELSLSYELKIAQILLGFMIVKNISFEKFRKIYTNILCFICIIAIVVYITVQMGLNWWQILPMGHNDEYYTLVFTVIPVNLANRSRLFGPFWEPGVFQAYINLAIVFLMIDRIKTKKLFIFIVAILLTFSTTGYICLIIEFFIYLTRIVKRISLWKVAAGILGIILVICILQNDYIQSVVFSKFLNESPANSSFVIRIKDFMIYFNEWLKSPVLGSGIMSSYDSAVSQYSLNSIYNNFGGSVSTTMREFAGMGGIVGILRLILQYKFCVHISSNIINKWLYFIIILIFLNTEDFIYSMMFNTVFFYGLGTVYKNEESFVERKEYEIINNSSTKLQCRKIYRGYNK